MDRLPRPFIACGLGLLVASAGCRATRPEVPPGRPFAQDGQQRKAIEFSSDGHPVNGAATANFMPNNLGGSNLASGIGSSGGRPDGSALGGPPGAYGPPGTAGMAAPNSGDPATSRASTAPAEMPPPGLPPLGGSPPATIPDLNVTQPREIQPMPNQVVIPPSDNVGNMGTPNQSPSPM